MTVVFKVSENIKKMMIEHYELLKCDKTPPYALFQVKDYDCVTTLYESGKVMFQGIGADIEASYWIEQERILNNRIIDISTEKKDKKDKDNKKINFNFSTIGSDEVGTGDYFGPIVVTASFVSKENISFLQELGVKDSKKLTDEKIIEIAPKIIKKIPYVTYVFDNPSYNKFYSENCNMNKIKAILHNKVLCSLIKKDNFNYEKIVIDQFVNSKKYFEYLKEASEKVTNIFFLIKAEDQVASVAASSIISRYIFLKEMKKISEDLGITIPFGAGEQVDLIGKEIVKKFGEEKLHSIAKLNFKNTNKIKE